MTSANPSHMRSRAFVKTSVLAVCAATFSLLLGCAATETRRSTGEYLDDASIGTRVKTALLADSTTDGLDIEVETFRGQVQLIGFAETDEERRRATEIARGIEGVVSVDNDLKVTNQGSRRVGQYVDDKVLVARVKSAIANDPDASAMQIEIEVNRGIVVLGGYVDSVAERERAEAAVRRVEGVQEVANNLRVRHSG